MTDATTVDVDRAALAIFLQALALEPAERDVWITGQCGANGLLLARVRRLVAADEANTTELEAAAGTGPDLTPALPPAQVGPYRLDELIGAGGMGSVYRARRNDGLFDQTVAIKFIRPLPGLVHVVRPLIDAERKLLARMEHPAIARILDGGTTENGLHYLVMEYVKGVALDHHARLRKLDTRQRMQLLREVCAAVSHAHQHLVLHCDIKPANILVTDEGRPKLIDFGVARIQDVVDASRPEGYTRGYTSPQRLAGVPAAVPDDVFSLGVVLTELVTGVHPDDPDAEDGRGTAQEDPIHTDAAARPLVGDLAAIAKKAVAPEREQRYATVSALADDLQRWLEHRPVAAMGSDWRYRTRKLVERHPWRVAFGSLALTGLVVALVVISTLYSRAESARRDAEKRFAEVRALANYMLFDLDSQLQTTAGNTQARRDMVGRSQQYLDALAATAAGNAELQREVAVGWARLAEVQGVPGRAHVGDPAGAKSSLERAERSMLTLTAQQPDRLDWRRDLGKVRYLLALIHGGYENDPARQLAKARQAEADLLRALDGQASWRPDGKALGELQVLLTSTRLTQADALAASNDHLAAARLQGAEELRLLDLPEAVRNNIEYAYQSGRPAVLLGDSLYYLGRYEDALAAYRRAVARFERGLQETPRHKRLLDGTLIGYWKISASLDGLGRHAQALEAIEPAVQLSQRLVDLDPGNLEAVRMRDVARGHRAVVLANLGRLPEAIAMIEQTLLEKEARAKLAPDDAERARDIAVPLRNLAGLHHKAGDAAGACRVLRRAVQEWSTIEQRWGLSDMDRRFELQVTREQLRTMCQK